MGIRVYLSIASGPTGSASCDLRCERKKKTICILINLDIQLLSIYIIESISGKCRTRIHAVCMYPCKQHDVRLPEIRRTSFNRLVSH